METIKGFVDHIIFQNADNGYTVLSLSGEDGESILVGMMKGISQGDSIQAEGDFVEHPVYGEQFKVVTFKTVMPEDAASMERYLASGAIKGIGTALAARIVKKFGEDTFRIMEEEPERLVEIKGISERIAREISAQMEEKKDMREAFLFLQQFGITNALAVKIYNTYGNRLYTVLQENPYKMAEDIDGVGFRVADEIAGRIGIHTDSDYRIRSGILYVLLQGVQEGHIYLPGQVLLARASELLGVEEAYIEPQISNLAMDRKIVVKKPSQEADIQVFAANYYYAELNCARMLMELNIPMEGDGNLLPAQENLIRKRIENITAAEELELDELQEKAVLECVKNGVFILSGGPGTGKTTTINTIIRYFEAERLDIFLAAPTGRAAKRMTETTGYEARTIHRMLELTGALDEDGGKNIRFEKNQENPLEADVIIIDEMSMVDINLLQALLKAIVPGTRLILVGDVDQLPSVGPGQVLRDIMAGGAFPMVILKKIFRQAQESGIVVNAHRINGGEEPNLDNKSRDFFFLERDNVNVIYKHMVQLITEKLPRYVGTDAFEIQVLTPMRKGNLGVETLNRILQQYVNPPSPEKKEHTVGETVFREGDKVMQTKNNYELEWEIVSKYGIPIDKGLGIFNGDMGRILQINEYAGTIVVEYDEHRRVTYPFIQVEELELAYAITIHKAQGSEYAAVVMPLLSGPRMLFNRNLLYTGVTRAKSCVTILGSSMTIGEMVRNAEVNRRYTALAERIKELAEE
ncbi:MAG: ATP-dependent RecD-like DNA helicase [Lachnospiraceae bacterium]|nr:ATP-dependent RecD-like DNA helicase [Lachnospiraceae bacterium]MBQ9136096.1 ATP-dependent RecD-like DNA helicase [Lachnospiraceae bacterium]